MRFIHSFSFNLTPSKYKQPFSTAKKIKIHKIRIRLFYVLIMLWVGRSAIFIRRRDDYASIDLLAMVQIVIVIILLFLLFSPLKVEFVRLIKKTSLKYYFLYLILGAISALWSLNPKYSLYRAMEAFAMSGAILYFCASAETLDESIRRVQLIVWPTLLANWLGLIILMGFSLRLRLNGFGAIATLTATFFAAWLLSIRSKYNPKNLLQAALGLFFVFVSFSLASWWSFWFGICYCAVFTKRKGLIVALVLTGVSLFLLADQNTRQEIMLFDKQYDNVGSLHGRKILWTDYWQASQKRPLLGYGFAIGAREAGKIYNTNAHNMFFGALLSIGWIGVCFGALFFFAFARELLMHRHHKNPVWLACASAIAAGCLNSMSVSIIGEQFNLAAVIFLSLLGLHLFFLKTKRQQLLANRWLRQFHY